MANSSTAAKIQKLCDEDLMGIPVDKIDSVYMNVYKEPPKQSHLLRLSTADFIRVEMSKELAEVEYQNRRLFIPRQRANELIRKRPDDYKLVFNKVDQVKPSGDTTKTIGSCMLPAVTPLRRPKIDGSTQTSGCKLTPPEKQPDLKIVKSEFLRRYTPLTRETIKGEATESEDDETKSIIEEENQAEFSPRFPLFRKPSSRKFKADTKNSGLEEIKPNQEFMTGFRCPSKCGSVTDFFGDDNVSDSDESNTTINCDTDGLDSGHESPASPTVSNKAAVNKTLDYLQGVMNQSFAEKRKIMTGIERCERESRMLQSELKRVQIESRDVLTLIELIESGELGNDNMAKLSVIMTPGEDGEEIDENILKLNAKLIQDILHGKGVDLNQIQLPNDKAV